MLWLKKSVSHQLIFVFLSFSVNVGYVLFGLIVQSTKTENICFKKERNNSIITQHIG